VASQPSATPALVMLFMAFLGLTSAAVALAKRR
jgi:hypothetical protein